MISLIDLKNDRGKKGVFLSKLTKNEVHIFTRHEIKKYFSVNLLR